MLLLETDDSIAFFQQAPRIVEGRNGGLAEHLDCWLARREPLSVQHSHRVSKCALNGPKKGKTKERVTKKPDTARLAKQEPLPTLPHEAPSSHRMRVVCREGGLSLLIQCDTKALSLTKDGW